MLIIETVTVRVTYSVRTVHTASRVGCTRLTLQCRVMSYTLTLTSLFLTRRHRRQGGQEAVAPPPSKNSGKYFSGKYVHFGDSVNFPHRQWYASEDGYSTIKTDSTIANKAMVPHQDGLSLVLLP